MPPRGAGLIPKKHAATIAAACDATLYDPAALVPVARRSMTLTVAVVKALTAEVRRRDEEAAAYVHWGATSQDVLDTAMVLQLSEAVPPIIESLHGIVAAFARLARKHRATPVMGRTLMQPATPLAFGQRVAGWASDIDRATRRLEASFAETQILQFGGASGSLSALGRKAEPVMKALAKGLGLALPPAPWFAQRVRIAGFAQDAALVTGALGKAAKDIALMMQYELQEVAEPSGPGRGSSSTMPHKRNPVGAGLALTAAARTAQLAATIVAAMPQENERALGGWQAEWPSLAGLLEALGSAVEGIAEVAPDLTVFADRMQANLDATNGAVLAERATFLLAETMGKDKAGALVEQALAQGRLVRRGAGPARGRAFRQEGDAGLLAEVRRPAAGRTPAALTDRVYFAWQFLHWCVKLQSLCVDLMRATEWFHCVDTGFGRQDFTS